MLFTLQMQRILSFKKVCIKTEESGKSSMKYKVAELSFEKVKLNKSTSVANNYSRSIQVKQSRNNHNRPRLHYVRIIIGLLPLQPNYHKICILFFFLHKTEQKHYLYTLRFFLTTQSHFVNFKTLFD